MRCPACHMEIEQSHPRATERCPRCGAGLPAITPSPGPGSTLLDGSAPGSSAHAGAKASPLAFHGAPDGSFFGPYRIEACIGQGGMGAVYRAVQQTPRRVVALKVLLHGDALSAEHAQRFQREAQLVAGLRHPGIIVIHDVGASRGIPYFTMDYIEGPSLAALLAREKRLSPERALPLVRAVALALEHAHERGVIHRDIKPGNILLDGEEQPILSDFGLARELTSETRLTRSGTTLGTPAYMSPEQADGETGGVDRRGDVYSLGAVLYECLTGQPPFTGSSEVQVLYKLLNTEPKRARELVPGLPLDVDTICLRCLEKDPARRYPTARALADEIGRWLDGEPILARPTGLLTRAGRRLRRRRTEAVFACAAVLSGLAIGAYLWKEARRAESARAAADEAARRRAAQELAAEENRRENERACREGATEMSAGRFERALEAFTRAIDADPSDAEARVRRAEAFQRSGRLERAHADLDEAVRIDPLHASALLLRGELRCAAGEYARAVLDLECVLRAEGKNVRALAGLGLARLRQKEWEKAREAFQRAAEAAPSEPGPHVRLAAALAGAGALDAAFSALNRASELGRLEAEALETEVDLAPLRGDERWGSFLARVRGGGK
ncbi:MAG: protein kinase [Planctomycetes bacterium]|nr:protein kinase [Planctomycetota bacterium]